MRAWTWPAYVRHRMHQANEGVLHKYRPWTMRQAQEDTALQRVENLTWFAVREDVWRYTKADWGWRP